LNDAGISVEDLSHTIEGAPTIETETVGFNEFLESHDGETTHVERDIFFHNDTPMQSDNNELQLKWGGEGSDVGVDGTGVNADGSYQLSIAGMTPEGSMVDGQSIDPLIANQDDTLRLAISPSLDSQSEVFMVDINPDGTVDIPADSPAAQFF